MSNLIEDNRKTKKHQFLGVDLGSDWYLHKYEEDWYFSLKKRLTKDMVIRLLLVLFLISYLVFSSPSTVSDVTEPTIVSILRAICLVVAMLWFICFITDIVSPVSVDIFNLDDGASSVLHNLSMEFGKDGSEAKSIFMNGIPGEKTLFTEESLNIFNSVAFGDNKNVGLERGIDKITHSGYKVYRAKSSSLTRLDVSLKRLDVLVLAKDKEEAFRLAAKEIVKKIK